MELLITVKTPLSEHQYTIETDLDPELPYAEFIEKLDIKNHLDQAWPNWTNFEIEIADEITTHTHTVIESDCLPEFDTSCS
jgi:hypothetical protein